MGNLILSRSFTLGDDEEEEREEEKDHTTGDDENADIHNTSLGSAMDVDAAASATKERAESSENEDSEDEDDDEETNTLEVVMVPLADILNARYQCENVQDSSIHLLRSIAEMHLIG
jgi:SET domain-containing protein 6